MRGPRFLPSGRRFGPYFWSRLEASAELSPLSALVESSFTTSLAVIACQVAPPPSKFASAFVLILVLR